MSKVIWGLSIAGLLILSASGTHGVWKQHRTVTTSRPVEGTVVRNELRKHVSHGRRGRVSTSYEPVVVYRYQVAGRAYTSRNVFPRAQHGGAEWAAGIISRFPPGSKHEAYHDPLRPGQAFLLRHYSFEPYVLALLPFGILGLALHFGHLARKGRPESPRWRADGWYEVKAANDLGTKLAFALLIAGLWHGAGLLLAGHYFLATGPSFSTEAVNTTWIYEAAGLIPLASAVYFHLLRRSVGSALVMISTGQPCLGGELGVRLEQEVHRDLELQSLRVGLVCEETSKVRRGTKTTISTDVSWERWETPLQDRQAYQGDFLKAEVRLPVPAGGKPSTPPGTRGYPR